MYTERDGFVWIVGRRIRCISQEMPSEPIASRAPEKAEKAKTGEFKHQDHENCGIHHEEISKVWIFH
jgi:hypothetical protein